MLPQLALRRRLRSDSRPHAPQCRPQQECPSCPTSAANNSARSHETVISSYLRSYHSASLMRPGGPSLIGPHVIRRAQVIVDLTSILSSATCRTIGGAALRLRHTGTRRVTDRAASFERPDHVQVSLNIPPWPHQPGGPHIDGLTPPETDGRPGTFTMLAGIFLTDQSCENAGNLWVWPGSHLAAADHLREQGPDALLSCVPYPPVELGEARQVTTRPGDTLFAHYRLDHNIGGNTSQARREVLYFRLRRTDHRARCVRSSREPLLEFEPVRAALDGPSRPRNRGRCENKHRARSSSRQTGWSEAYEDHCGNALERLGSRTEFRPN